MTRDRAVFSGPLIAELSQYLDPKGQDGGHGDLSTRERYCLEMNMTLVEGHSSLRCPQCEKAGLVCGGTTWNLTLLFFLFS